MCLRGLRSIGLLSLFLSLSFFAPCQSQKYLVSSEELDQILSECQSLRLQITSLKNLQLTDSQELKTLSEQLGALKLDNERETKLLTDSTAQLETLKESLKQSKQEALLTDILIGAGGAAVGAIIMGVIKWK